MFLGKTLKIPLSTLDPGYNMNVSGKLDESQERGEEDQEK